jgi:hypothetical protein
MTVTMLDVDIWLHDFLQVQSIQVQRAGEYKIEKVLQGSEQLSFTLQLDDPKLQFIHEDQLLLADDSYWIVDHFEDEHPGHRTIVASARWIELSWRTRVGVFSLLARTPLQGLTTILSGSGWTVGSVPADPEVYSIEEMDGTNLSLIRRWALVTGYEVEFDTVNKEVSFVESVGQAREIGFRWGQNIKSIKRTFYPPPATRLIPIGANNLQISNVNPTGQNYIEDFSFYTDQGLTITQARNLYRKDLIWVDERYLVEVNLYDAAVLRLAKLSRPRVFYEADVLDLSRIMGGEQGFQPGDTMPVDDEIIGVLEDVRVTRTIKYPNEPRKDRVELGFLTNGMLDVSTGSTREVNYAELIPIVDQNVELLNIGPSETNYGEISVTSTGSTILIAGSTFVGIATGTGTIRFKMVIDGVNIGEPRDIAFTDGQQVEFSWPTFATDLADGAHDVHWRAQVISGAGTVALDEGDGRSWVLIRGAVGVGTSSSPNQFVSEEILTLLLSIDTNFIDDYVIDITESDDLEDQNFTIEETIATLTPGYVDAIIDTYEAELAFAFGVYWLDNSDELHEASADTISRDVPLTSALDDLVVVFLYHRGGASDITAPAGFTRIAQAFVDDGTIEQYSEVWTKTDDGTMAGTTLTFDGVPTDRMGMMIGIVRNAEGGTVDVDVVDDTGEYIATFTDPGEERFPDVSVVEPFRLGVFFVSCAYAETSPTETTYSIDFFAPISTVAPVVSTADALDYGAELSCTTGDWHGASSSFAYQWRFVSDDSPLPGASTGSTYTPAPADELELSNEAVYCEVTAVNVHGSTSVDSSNNVTIPLPRRATGGTTSDDGSLVTHTFSANGTFELLVSGLLPVSFVIAGTGSFDGVSSDGTADVTDPVTVVVTSGTVEVSYDPFAMTFPFFAQIAMLREFWAEDPDWTSPGDGNVIASLHDAGSLAQDLAYAAMGGSPVQPVYVNSLIGGRPGFDFRATSDLNGGRLHTTGGSSGTTFSIIVVGRLDELLTSFPYFTDASAVSAGNRAIIGGASGGTWRAYNVATGFVSGGTKDTDVHVFVAVFKNNDIRFYIDGALIGSDTSVTIGSAPGFSLGGNVQGNGSALDGAIGYATMYSGDITAHADYSDWLQRIKDHYSIP